jgi:hypothetical protein
MSAAGSFRGARFLAVCRASAMFWSTASLGGHF